MTTKSTKTTTIKKVENGKATNGQAKKSIEPSIEELRKLLDKQISIYNKKSQLIANRDTFEETRDLLVEYLKEMSDEYDATLDSRNLKLVLVDNRLYRDDQKVSIANNAVINDLIQGLIVRINQRIQNIEKEIIS